jgi:hypothetical protein
VAVRRGGPLAASSSATSTSSRDAPWTAAVIARRRRGAAIGGVHRIAHIERNGDWQYRARSSWGKAESTDGGSQRWDAIEGEPPHERWISRERE